MPSMPMPSNVIKVGGPSAHRRLDRAAQVRSGAIRPVRGPLAGPLIASIDCRRDRGADAGSFRRRHASTRRDAIGAARGR
jgi:hypothetical protein